LGELLTDRLRMLGPDHPATLTTRVGWLTVSAGCVSTPLQ
jgi:hypothetical protein